MSSSSSSSSSSACSNTESSPRIYKLSPRIKWNTATINSGSGSSLKRSRTTKLSPPPNAAVPPSPLSLSPPRPILESSVVKTTLPRLQPLKKRTFVSASSSPFHKKSTADKADDRNPRKSAEMKKQKKEVDEGADDEEEMKVWNLRPRIPVEKKAEMNVNASAENNDKKRTKLTIALTKKEIEDDIFGLTGAKPTRRPRKRTKTIQKQLDALFPGLWLPSITADSYKVSETSYKE